MTGRGSTPGLLQSVDSHALSPVYALAGTLLVVLVADLFLQGRRKRLALPVSLAGTLVALGLTVSLVGTGTRGTFCTPAATLPQQVGGLAVGRSCSYVVDRYALLLDVVLLGGLLVVLLLGAGSLAEDRLPPGEHHVLLLAATLGGVVVASSRDLLILVVGLEVVSLPAFVLAGLKRGSATAAARSAEAALKYFLVSVLSTAVSLFGMAMLYGLTGSLQLDRIALQLAQPSIRTPAAAAAVALTLVGFAFKVSAAPFHTWAPDVYDGSPLPVAAYLSVVSKTAGFAGLFVLCLQAFRPYAGVWGPIVAVLAVASMTLGNLVALQQRDAVRLLAWSSIAQAGYILAPLAAAATARGRGDLDALLTASLGYLAFYAVTQLGAFACLAAARVRDLVDLRGLAGRSPAVAAAFALALFGLAGLPPGLAGLFGKVVVFRAVVDAHAGWLAVVVAVNTVIGLAYYLRLAALLFSGLGEGAVRSRPARGLAAGGRPVRTAVALTALVALAVGVAPVLVLHVTPLATIALP